jgi:hypothetical protein
MSDSGKRKKFQEKLSVFGTNGIYLSFIKINSKTYSTIFSELDHLFSGGFRQRGERGMSNMASDLKV